jgi:hypothetical protein
MNQRFSHSLKKLRLTVSLWRHSASLILATL